MFKVKCRNSERDSRIKTVYATRYEDGVSWFLFHYYEGWVWESANDYIPVE